MWNVLAYRFAGNELWRVMVLFTIILLSLVIGRIARFLLGRASKGPLCREKEWVAVLFRALAKPVVLLSFYLGMSLWVKMQLLRVTEGMQSLFTTIVDVLGALAVGYVIYSLVDVIDYKLTHLADRTKSRLDDILAPLVGKSIRFTIFALVALNVVHSVSGKSITTILAGLGVGGLAVALAAQDTVKNFFGSIVILGDKPFEIGDRIIVEGHDGPVESVGFRSTRLRTLSGHLVTIPNSEMVNRTVQNIGKRPFIRRLMNITITYDTPPERVELALRIVKEILADHEGMNPDFPPRVFFSEFNDCSLGILAIYWYHPPDYWKYMEFSERVNMQLLSRFNEEGIEFAFPTQTLYLANDEKRQLALKMLREGSTESGS